VSTTEPRRPRHLPTGLTATVGEVEALLGEVVADTEGSKLFDAVEGVRRAMVAFREGDDAAARERALDEAAGLLASLDLGQKTALARAYTLYLQLVNVCENAYRTHRLRQRRKAESGERPRAELTFVLTAHPTESRSPENIRLLRRIQNAVIAGLERGDAVDRPAIQNLIRLAWRVGTHPERKPSVEDEANHLFSLLDDPILTELLSLTESGHRVLLRSWVGGDKDGHPGVGPDQTVAALQRARARLLSFVETALMGPVREDAALVAVPPVDSALDELEGALRALEAVRDGDGGRVTALREAIEGFQSTYGEAFGASHPGVDRLATLLEVFPALAVPLELREERGRFGTGAPIADMMRRIADVASGGSVGDYARAVVVSMTLAAEDLLEAQRCVEDVFGEPMIPVIPLFELPDVLERAEGILDETWQDPSFRSAVRTRGYLEVMLGYSDTAKRMGMLASRVALHDAMRAIGVWGEAHDVRATFFHGHGGSVGRGGGRIEDVMATWPPRARRPYKYTVQGEMVERTLATPEILRSLVEKVAEVQAYPPEYREVGAFARDLAAASQQVFSTTVSSSSFLELLEHATPYTRLQALTIGSRPARRGSGGLEKLRAIPWVLCWTQTRLLLHAWLGVGRAWRQVADEAGAAARLDEASGADPLFRSYARLLGFTLAKTEPAIWRRYGAALIRDEGAGKVATLDEDYRAAVDFACRAMGGDALLPDRPWLEESIRYRAPMIHPLNLLQIELLSKAEWSDEEVALFRETVTGIAAGMLTTG